MSRSHTVLTLAVALVVVTVAAPPRPAQAAEDGPRRHHITLGAGYARHLADEFEDDGLEDCVSGQFAYRYSVTPTLDLALDGRSVTATEDVQVLGEDGEFSHTSSYFGPGVRFNGAAGSVRPFLQVNVFFARETVRLEVGNSGSDASENGAGFGVAGGADIRLSRLLSLPIEANFLYAKPENDLTSLGMQVGLTFNFGVMP